MSDAAAELLDELGLGAPTPVSKTPTFIRELTHADIKSLENAKPVAKAAPNLIAKLRYTHHTLARLVAEGKDRVECAAITGYTTQYVTDLQKDPAFAELVSHYKEQIGQKYMDVHERLASLGVVALEELQDRLTDPEKVKQVTTTQLREIVESTFDRSIAPSRGSPTGGSQGNARTTVNIHFGKPADAGKSGGPGIGPHQAPLVIDVTPTPALVPAPKPSGGMDD